MDEYFLPNGSKIDFDSLIDALKDRTGKCRYFLDLQKGEVGCIEKGKNDLQPKSAVLRETARYVEIAPVAENVQIQWMREYLDEFLQKGDKRERLLYASTQKILSDKKPHTFERILSLVEKDKRGSIHGWVQWQEDQQWDEVVNWLEMLPVAVESKFKGCGECELCKLMEMGEHTIGDFFEASVKQNRKVMETKKQISASRNIPPRQIFQLKITLDESSPKIWRRIAVPSNYTFFQLHIAIQNAFGWGDSHLHAFVFKNKNSSQMVTIQFPDSENEPFFTDTVLDERVENISDYFDDSSKRCKYTYDFGDNWDHTILFEREIKKERGKKYPLCADGANACPPDDCGGAWGYKDLQEKIKNSGHAEHKEMIEWLGLRKAQEFDPYRFDPKKIVFENTHASLKEYERQFGVKPLAVNKRRDKK